VVGFLSLLDATDHVGDATERALLVAEQMRGAVATVTAETTL